MNLQPIATAPKDGSNILGHAEGEFAVLYWVERRGWQLRWPGAFAEDSDWCYEPTEWVDLRQIR